MSVCNDRYLLVAETTCVKYGCDLSAPVIHAETLFVFLDLLGEIGDIITHAIKLNTIPEPHRATEMTRCLNRIEPGTINLC